MPSRVGSFGARLLIPALVALFGVTAAVHSETAISTTDAAALLRSHKFDELDRHFSQVQAGYRSGALSDVDLRTAFRAFYLSDASLEPEFDAWVAAYPKSYVAHLARGIYFKECGRVQRGPLPYAMTDPAQLELMEQSFVKASAEFKASYALDRKPLLTYVHALNISTLQGERAEGRRLLRRSLQVDPKNVIARRSYMDQLRPRFGGTLPELVSFVSESRKAGVPKEKLFELQAVLAEEGGIEAEEQGDFAGAEQKFSQGAVLGQKQCVPCLSEVLTKQGKNQEALNMLTDALRKEPHDPAILRHRANVLWTLGQFRDALADLKAGADTGDAASEHELGQWYWNGVPGVLDPDRSAAMAWLRKSAAQGFAPAKVDLQAFSTVYEGPTK